MTEETPVEGEVQEDINPFPVLFKINDLTSEDGIDTDALTTAELLGAAREGYLMLHMAVQEVGQAMGTIAVVLGMLDDRVESFLNEDGDVATAASPTPSIILPTLSKTP